MRARAWHKILVVAATLGLLWVAGCGDTFRPVVTPLPGPGPDPDDPGQAVVVSKGLSGDGRTTHINVSGDTNMGEVSVGRGPVHAALVASGLRTFVANRDGDSLSSYATTQPQGASLVTITLPAGAQPVFLDSRAGNQVFVAMSGLNQVGTISLGGNILTAQIDVGLNPVALAHVPSSNKLYVANQGSDDVSVISLADNSVVATIPVGSDPVWMDASADGNFVFVANQGSGTVTVIRAGSDNVVATIPAGAAPNFLTFDERLKRVYVTSPADNQVTIINANVSPPQLLATAQVSGTPCNGAAPVSVAALADGSRAYVANRDSDSVCVISATSNAPIGSIAVGDGPAFVNASSDASKVYVANRLGNSISIIRTVDNTVLSTLDSPVPEPVFIAVTP